MATHRLIRVLGTNNEHMTLAIVGETAWGDLQLELGFDLIWVRGKVAAVCSDERLGELEAFIEEHAMVVGMSHCFLNEDGNLELRIQVLSTGMCRLQIVAMPDMVSGDGIEFGFEGLVHLIVEGGDEWHDSK